MSKFDKKVQKEVSQIANRKLSRATTIGGLSVNLNHPKNLIAQRVQFVIGHLGHFQLEFICQIWTQDTLRHILGPIMAIFEICPFLMTPGLFE